jgi:transitional endoplasmic reticulum ATPase
MPTKPKTNASAAAAAIAELILGTGEPLGEVNVVREGDQITLPEGMAIPEAITWLKRKDEADNTRVTFQEYIDGFPLDAARALSLAVKEMFGFKGVSDFWPQSVSLEINADHDTEQVYIGAFQVPNIEGEIKTDWGGPMKLLVSATVKQKDQEKIKSLMTLTRKKLKEQSVYRNKAFKLSFDARSGRPLEPKFMRADTLGQLQVNDDIRDLLQAAVWTPLQKTERCRKHKIPLKRGILLEGPYGTGKSLFAAETATIAESSKWTFVYLDDIKWLAQAYDFAAFYAPAVLFAEDIDIVLDGNGELPDAIRNTIDGVNTKKSDVLLVLTTNHAEKLPKSILRPGRLDAIVPFRAPDAKTVRTLIRQYAGSLLSPSENLEKVASELDGRIPAVIREVVERAKLQMIERTTDHDEQLASTDLEIAARSMLHQLSLLEAEPAQGDSMLEVFGKAVGQGIHRGYVESHFADTLLNIRDENDVNNDSAVQEVTAKRAVKTISANSGH